MPCNKQKTRTSRNMDRTAPPPSHKNCCWIMDWIFQVIANTRGNQPIQAAHGSFMRAAKRGRWMLSTKPPPIFMALRANQFTPVSKPCPLLWAKPPGFWTFPAANARSGVVYKFRWSTIYWQSLSWLLLSWIEKEGPGMIRTQLEPATRNGRPPFIREVHQSAHFLICPH